MGVNSAHWGYIYPLLTLPTGSLSNWMSLSLNLQPNAGHHTLSDGLIFSSGPANTVVQLARASPQPFLAYRMTEGLRASCQT